MGNITKQQLINFEDSIKQLWESGELKCLCHFAGGNEDQLIEYFKCVGEDDWCFSTWRSSYHFLLKTGDFEYLYDQIVNKNNSMHITDVSRWNLRYGSGGRKCLKIGREGLLGALFHRRWGN
jgi:TPP-dependent pyruvate/acetoin dehydrogenase alpha subunit